MGLDKLIEENTGLAVHVAENSVECSCRRNRASIKVYR